MTGVPILKADTGRGAVKKIKSEGKRFSRTESKKVTTDDGVDHFYEKIDWNYSCTPAALEAHCQRAIKILLAGGIKQSQLADSQHGSAIRDYVLNILDKPRDSQLGLAAQILEVALHLQAYNDLPGGKELMPSLATRLGRLASLLDTYQIDSEIQAKRRQGKPSSDPYDTGRNDRMRKYHNRLKGCPGAVKQTSIEFELSERQTSRIVHKKK